MSILDNNKKKRDQKSSETEKELALAQLQDRFLGFKAPKADFLKKIVVGISPALLPKKDKVKEQTSGHEQNALANPKINANTPLTVSTSVPLAPSVTLGLPLAEPIASKIEISAPLTEGLSAPENITSVKPVSSFDFLDVGISASTAPKTKSFLAHFAKKDKPIDKDNKDK